MTTATLRAPASTPLPDLAYLGAAPLLPGDDADGYDTLHARMLADVRPGNAMEEAWTRDVVDHVWEAVRLRRLKAALMTACADEGMRRLLTSLGVTGNTFDLARRWAARELGAVGEVDAILNGAGLGIKHVMARTLQVTIAEVERIEHMIASVEARRAAALREMAHHRDSRQFVTRLREAAAAQIEHAELANVAAPALAAAEAGA
jgi:hypothetical protein